MKRYRFALLGGALLLALAACGCNRLKARDNLNKGVQAYRNAQFQPAIMHFKEAIRLDPSLLNARLYLATAYAQQYVPGGESDDNKKVAQQAIDAFQDVLRVDPGNTSALASIASIYYNQKKFEEAKDYQQKWLKIEPNNPVPYYWIGVLDWAVCFPRSQKLRVDHNLSIPGKNGDLPPIPIRMGRWLTRDLRRCKRPSLSSRMMPTPWRISI
jgi:tetratricopeptide (TPR) repeat protein